MVSVVFTEKFKRLFSKVKDNLIKEKVIKQIQKIKANPKVGKPMRYNRKGTRELYVSPYRLSYSYNLKEEKICLLNLYHKDEQ